MTKKLISILMAVLVITALFAGCKNAVRTMMARRRPIRDLKAMRQIP